MLTETYLGYNDSQACGNQLPSTPASTEDTSQDPLKGQGLWLATANRSCNADNAGTTEQWLVVLRLRTVERCQGQFLPCLRAAVERLPGQSSGQDQTWPQPTRQPWPPKRRHSPRRTGQQPEGKGGKGKGKGKATGNANIDLANSMLGALPAPPPLPPSSTRRYWYNR